MASHVLVHTYPVQDEIQMVQEGQEEGETGGKDEKLGEKDFLPHASPANLVAIVHTLKFPVRFIALKASPVIEDQTPPPDQA